MTNHTCNPNKHTNLMEYFESSKLYTRFTVRKVASSYLIQPIRLTQTSGKTGKDVSGRVKRQVSSDEDVSPRSKSLDSNLANLNVVRNVCAIDARITVLRLKLHPPS